MPVGDELSQIGEQTGQKVDSAMVSRGMRTAKDKNGERLLNSNEFLTSGQVASFFSRLASKRSVDVGTDSESQSDDEDQNEAERKPSMRIQSCMMLTTSVTSSKIRSFQSFLSKC